MLFITYIRTLLGKGPERESDHKVLYNVDCVCPITVKNNFKIYIKIDIKMAPTCFSAVTPSSGSALLMLAKVTVVKIAN